MLSEDGLVFRITADGRAAPMVPTALQPDVLCYFHTALVFQHQGSSRTYFTLRQWYYWHGMKAAIYQFYTECEVCRRTRKGADLGDSRHAPF